MLDIFKVNITNRIEIVSNYNFNKELCVVVYDNNLNELYNTKFIFKKNIICWIDINKLTNIIINIFDDNEVIFNYNSDDDFVYVTCGDLYYMDLIEKLVISLLNVSEKKIIVYGINCKVPFDYPNMIKREYISPVKTIHDKWFWKQRVCIEALKENFINYVWVDGDIIANINIDSISSHFYKIENYPIGDVHVNDEQIVKDKNTIQYMGENICNYFSCKRKVIKKDLHACFFAYNNNCEWFFKEILDLYNNIYNIGLYDDLLAWNDESLHNFMHSKYNFTKTLSLSNLSLLCDHTKYESNPKTLKIFYDYWNKKSPNNFGERFGWSYVPEDKNQILYFHENKNLNDADEMIEFIKMKKNDTFSSSKWFYISTHKIHNFEKNNSLKTPIKHQYLKEIYNESNFYEYNNLLNINNNDVVLDIGANIGFFERYSYLKNANKIICFEPDKEKFEILKLNSSDNAVLFNADVTDSVGKYKIETDTNEFFINTYTIDYLFESKLINKIDFLKIDSYNNEKKILQGISDDNLKKISKISIKWLDFNTFDENEKNNIVGYYLKRGFNSFVNLESKGYARLYFYKK